MVSTGAIALLRDDILLLAVLFFCPGFFVSLRFVLSNEPRAQAESECGCYLCGFVATAFFLSLFRSNQHEFLRRFLHINSVGQTPAKLRGLKKSHFRLHSLWNSVENDAKRINCQKWSPVPFIVQPEECLLNVQCAFGAGNVIDFNLLNFPFYDFSLLMHHLKQMIYFPLFVLWISRQFWCFHRYQFDWFKTSFDPSRSSRV